MLLSLSFCTSNPEHSQPPGHSAGIATRPASVGNIRWQAAQARASGVSEQAGLPEEVGAAHLVCLGQSLQVVLQATRIAGNWTQG